MAWMVLPVFAASNVVLWNAGRRSRRERQHRCQTHYANADMGLPPSDRGDGMLDDGRPDHARKRAAGGRQGNGEAAVPIEPQRGVGHQGREARCAAESDCDAGDNREDRQVRSEGSEDVAEAHQDRASGQRWHDAESIRQSADYDAADHEADDGESVGQSRIGARRIEIGLHCRQRHDQGPHADAAQCAEGDGDDEANPGIRTLD